MAETEKTQTTPPAPPAPAAPAPAPPKPKPKPKRKKKRTARATAEKAPFGYDVIGEDDRRIARALSKTDAAAEANRITSLTGEQIDVVPAELSAPSVAVPEAEPAE